jgi:hypothetical protein
MKIIPVSDSAFDIYGKVVTGYNLTPVIDELLKTEKPDNAVVYVPSNPNLEKTSLFEELRDGIYGGLPIQFGYCNGDNLALNCLEFHRGSEVIIAADPIVLLLAHLPKMKNNSIDVSEVEAFLMPAGSAVLLYETSLHYAPCSYDSNGFRTIIVLPKGTNEEKPKITIVTLDDAILWGSNKWLIAHPDAPEAAAGAVIEKKRKNIVLDKPL